MNRTMALTVLVSVLAQTPDAPSADEPLLPARFVEDTPPVTKEGDVNVPYTGAVTEVTKFSISIRWKGEEHPKFFTASPTLADGEFPTLARPFRPGRQPRPVDFPFRYRLADVKVGDLVEIRFAQLNGVAVCDQISIFKRPGGRVPPLPEGAENLKPPRSVPPGTVYLSMIPYHERMNAYWDLKDKGIPYPEKFGRYRRFPVAPPPREKK